MRSLHEAFLVAAFTILVRFQFYRRFPIFTLYLLWMAIEFFGYAPESDEWIKRVYLSMEPGMMVLRALCALEVLFHQAMLLPRSGRLLAGLALTAVPYACLAWVLSAPSAGGVSDFVTSRRCVQIGTMAFMAAGQLFFLLFGKLHKVTAIHAALLTTYLIKQGITSVMGLIGGWTHWRAVDSIGLGVNCLLLSFWAVAAVVLRERLPLSLVAASHEQ